MARNCFCSKFYSLIMSIIQIGGAMKEVHSTYTELGRIERKSYDEVKYSVVIEAVSMNKVEG